MLTWISVPKEQIKIIKKICKKQNISRSELIRKAITLYLQTNYFPEASKAAFGLWKDKRKDGVEYQKEIRSEWE